MKTVDQLGKILAKMYADAPRNGQVTMIHLFGIGYHEDVRNAGIKEVIDSSGISSTYRTELNKAVNLASYVTPNDQGIKMLLK